MLTCIAISSGKEKPLRSFFSGKLTRTVFTGIFWLVGMLTHFVAEAQCITTSSVSVSISTSSNPATFSDDATEVGGNVFTNTPNLQLGGRYIGLRFPSVTIPKSATITNAYIQFTSSSNSGADIADVAIKGHNVGNSSTFTAATGSNELSTRYNSAGTSSIVYWGNGADWTSGEAGPNQRTNDLKAIVQEIIDRPDWNPANPITLLINATSSGTGPAAQSSENIGAASPKLIITYQQVTTIGLTATVSGCYNTTAGSRATVSVEVNWTNAPANETILVTLNGQTRTILPGLNVLNFYDPDGYPTPASVEIASPQIITFEVPADGASGPITTSFQTNTSCSASGSYTAPPACAPLTCTPGTDLSGIAFNDFNADGIHNTSETSGVPGVTVTAFDCAGTTFSAVTNANGQYKLTIPLANYPVRVEFSNLPAGYTAQGTLNNNDGRTTVQFVNAPDCSIDLGMLNPADYCQTNPKVFVPRYVNGNPLGGGTAGSLSAFLSSNDVDSSSFTPGTPGSGLFTSTAAPVQMVAASQVGALWGVAYDRQVKTIFTSAVLRRHAGLGTLGLGGIYAINPATNAVTNFLNVSSIGINVGTIGSNTDRGLPASTTTTSNDSDAFSQVGKVGIGGLTISGDGNQLYLVNLADKKVYGLDISAYNIGGTAPTTYTSYSIPNGCAVGGSNMRPWGIKYHLGKVYVGVVCDGSISKNRSELRAFVYALNPSNNTWNTAFNFPLTYPKGPSELFNDVTKAKNSNNWQTWTDTFAELIPDGNNLSHNQPILTGIEFDIDNSMILAFADRTGMQGGSRNYGPNAGDTKQYNTISGGDLLRVANRNGIYTLENNGRVVGQQGVFVNNNQGPGLGEFYNDNANFEGPILGYGENTLGGVALRPGSGNVIVSAMSPLNIMSQTFTSEQVNSANGLRRLSNTNGTIQSAYVIYQNSSPDFSQNTVGLGDVELGCSAATFIEIGSRVWTDTDKDGIQDPCEPTLAGVNVSLYKAGVLLATTVTSTNGDYFFSSKSKLTGGTWSGADTTLLPNTTYQVVFGSGGQFANGALHISGKHYELTQAFSTAPTASTLNDSNLQLLPVAGNNLPTANVTTGVLGSVNHAIDGGFVCTTINVATLTATPASCTGASANNNGQITLSGVQNAEKAFIYTTSAPSYTATGSQPISASVVSFTGLANPSTSSGQSYSVILYNGPSCFTVVATTLPQNNCNGCTLSLTATPGACSPATNAFSTSVVIRLASTVSGVMTVVDGPNSLTFAATAGTTQSFTAVFNGITANVASHTVVATLPGCATTSTTYTAPASCSAPVCSVVTSVQPGACFPATNTFSTIVYATVQNSIAGTLTITDGAQTQSFATTTSPATYSAVFSNMPSNGSAHTVTATLPGCATNTATYTAPVSCTQPAGAQLILDKVVDKSRAEAGETLIYTMVISNTGTAAASTVVVRDSMSTGLQHIGTPVVPANTTFTRGTPISTWTIPSLSAGQSLSMTFQVRADSAGIMYNRAIIPGDTAVACTSVPVIVCTGDQYTFELVAGLGRSSYRWFKDGVEIQNNGSNTLIINSPGSYSLAVDDTDPNKCPDFSCCPFIVEEDVLPNYQASTVAATCVNGTAQANGRIVLSGFNPAYKYQYSLGTDFNPAASLSGAPQTIPANGVIASTLANPATAQTYTIRVYNRGTCYTDVTVTLNPTVCCNVSVAATAGQCVPATNTYSTTAVVTLSNVTAGTLTITDGPNSATFATTTTASATFSAVFASIPANGASHTVVATLPGCSTATTTYSAPASCSVAPVCSLTAAVTAGACQTATNTYSANVMVNLTNAVAGSVSVTIPGAAPVSQTIAANATSVTVVVPNLLSDGAIHTATISLPGCGSTNATYSAPASCSVAPVCSLTAAVTAGTCQTATNTYSAQVLVNLTNAVAGSITVSIPGAAPISQTLAANATSVTVVVPGLTSDGAIHMATISLPGCSTTTATYTAPASCSVAPVCSLTAAVTAGLCQTATNTYSAQVLVNLTNAVAGSITVSIPGTAPVSQTLAANTTSLTVVVPNLPSDGVIHTATISLPGCSTTTATYTSPASCSIAPVCSLTAAVTAGTCQTATNTYSAQVLVNLTNAVAGSITVSIPGTAPVSQTLAANATSVTVVVPNLPSDGAIHTATISLPGCSTTTATYTSPASCSIAPLCSLTAAATGGLCQLATNSYSAYVAVNLTNPVAGTITVSIPGAAPVSQTVSSATTSLTLIVRGLLSDGAIHTATISLPGCGTTTANYTAPASCSVAPVCSLTAAATAGVCQTATNTYSANVVVNLTNAVAGSLTVSIPGAAPVSQTIAAKATSVTVVVPNLLSDGAMHTATISLPDCGTTTATYSAPASCSVGIGLSLSDPPICNPGTNMYSTTGVVSLTNATNGQLTITDGTSTTAVSVTAGTTSVSYSFTGLTTGTGTHTVVVSYLGQTTSVTYVAPDACPAEPVCSLTATATAGICASATNTYSLTAVVTLANSITGTLTITNGTESLTLSTSSSSTDSYTAIFNNLPSDGLTHTVEVSLPGCSSTTTTYSAPTSCTVVPVCSLTAAATAGVCQTATNTYSAQILVNLTNAVAGSITVSIPDAAPVSQTIAANATSLTVVVPNLLSDGAIHMATVSLPGCSTTTATYSAPASCSVAPVCSLTAAVTAGACQTATNTYSAQVLVNLTNAVAGSITVSIPGAAPVSQTIAANATSLTVVVPNLPSDGAIHMATISLPGCSTTTATYTSPASCSIAPLCSLTAAATGGLCQLATNSYSAYVAVNLTNPVAGTITVSIPGAAPVSQTVSSAITSLTLIVRGLLSDGAIHTATISLPGCGTTTANYTAPASCSASPGLSLTVVDPGPCQPGANTYSTTGVIGFTNVPSGVATVTDGAKSLTIAIAAGTTSVPYSMTGLPSGTGLHTVIVTFAGQTAQATYTAPDSCVCPTTCVPFTIQRTRTSRQRR